MLLGVVMRIFMVTIGLLAAANAWAGEYAVLTTGYRIHAERHAAAGETVTLYEKDGSYSEVPAALVASFEPDEKVSSADVAGDVAVNRGADPARPPDATEPGTIEPEVQPSVPALVAKASQEHGVHPALISSVIAAESGFRPSAVSPKGAVGLMQLMPDTARDLRVSDPRDAAQNIDGGTSYLRQLLDRYAGFHNQLERALAAYNAGPANVDRYGGLPPYRETVDFVSRVSTRMKFLLEDR